MCITDFKFTSVNVINFLNTHLINHKTLFWIKVGDSIYSSSSSSSTSPQNRGFKIEEKKMEGRKKKTALMVCGRDIVNGAVDGCMQTNGRLCSTHACKRTPLTV